MFINFGSKGILFLALYTSFNVCAQSQFGLSFGLNHTSIKSNDIYVDPGIGYELGVKKRTI